MTTQDLKHKVIDKVNELEDENILLDLIKMIDDSNIDNDMYSISLNHREAINKAIKQIENGEYLTDEQSNKQIDKWLNE
jgi:hypothetical protein